MADLPDDLELLENIAADLRARLARIEGRIRRLKDAQWREFQKERFTALGLQGASEALLAAGVTGKGHQTESPHTPMGGEPQKP